MPSNNLTKDEAKAAMKEAIKEWMDEQLAQFGMWSLRFLFVAALGALAYFILTMNGWHK